MQTFRTATCSIPYVSVTNEIKVFAQGSAAEAAFKLSASVLYNELHTTVGSQDPGNNMLPRGRFGSWNVLQVTVGGLATTCCPGAASAAGTSWR